jgi:hypothetical protein
MNSNRRKGIRRHSDRILRKILEVLRDLEKVSEGQHVDFTEAYADLVALKDQLGRRREDRKLAEDLCATIESLAHRLSPQEALNSTQQQGIQEERPRRVRLFKVSGGGLGTQVSGTPTVEGWEESPPQTGKVYRIFKDNGGLFRTSVIRKVSSGYIQTQNSLYRLEVIQEADNENFRNLLFPPKGKDRK